MSLTLVRYSKKQAEVHIFPADFTSQLLLGETITSGSWVYTVTVITGTDPNPSAILLNVPQFVGNTVTQQLQQGIPGVIYRIVIVVETSLDRFLSLETKLAVLPNDYPADGVYVSYYETSLPYPAYSTPVDVLNYSFSVVSGTLQSTLYNLSEQDTLHFSFSVVSGTLQSVLYNLPEQDTLHYTFSVVSGSQTTVLVNNNEQDTLHYSFSVVSGSQLTTLVNNSQQDTLHFTFSIVSGTLT